MKTDQLVDVWHLCGACDNGEDEDIKLIIDVRDGHGVGISDSQSHHYDPSFRPTTGAPLRKFTDITISMFQIFMF